MVANNIQQNNKGQQPRLAKYSKNVTSRFKQLVETKRVRAPEDASEAYDSDSEVDMSGLRPNDKVDVKCRVFFRITQRISPGLVVETCGDVLLVRVEDEKQQPQKFLAFDHFTLGPFQQMQSYYEEVLELIFN